MLLPIAHASKLIISALAFNPKFPQTITLNDATGQLFFDAPSDRSIRSANFDPPGSSVGEDKMTTSCTQR